MAAQDNFFVKNKSILTFLILEIVALTAFNFGNAGYIFGLAGVLLAVFGMFFVYNIEENKKKLLWLLLPFGLLLIVSAIGSFNGFSKNFPLLSNISLLLSLPAFLILGFVIRKLNDVKPKIVLLVVGGGLAAITFFGLASTIIQYGFFYSLIYKSKPLYFFDGWPYDVTKEMYWLNGFSFGEVFIEYGSLFALLCASFLPGLLFVSPKKERNEFIVGSVIGGIGLLTLLVIPNWKALVILILASAFAFAFKFLKNHKKVQKILGISFVSLVGLGIIFFVIVLINASTGFKFGAFLERIFEKNAIMLKCQETLKMLFYKDFNGAHTNLFGLVPYEYNKDALVEETGIFEVQLLKEVGLLGTFIFIGFILVMGYFLFNYIKKSKDEDSVKSINVTMLLAFFLFETLFYISSYEVHDDASYTPFLRNPSLLVMLFLFGYTFMPLEKEGETNE